MSLKELCCLPCSLWLSVAWNFLQRKKSTWFASCKLNLLERIHLQVASLMQFSFEHSIKTLPGLKGSRKSSSEWEIWRFSPSLQDAILEQRSHAVFVYCPESIAHVALVLPEMTSTEPKCTDGFEKYGGLRRGWNVPRKWIRRSRFTLGSFQKMGDLFLCCNVWLRAWPSVRGRYQRVFHSLRWCFEKRAISVTEHRISKHVIMADSLRVELF